MFISLVEGKAVVNEQGMELAIVKKVYKADKSNHKVSFEKWMRFVYHVWHRDSIYRNYMPKEREKKVVTMVFPDKTVSYFKGISGMKDLIDVYIDMCYSFKEKIYIRLLNDIEVMMDKLSKIELTKTARVIGEKEVTWYSKKTEKEETETIPLSVRVTIDNSEEKIKAMDVIDKLLKREAVLKEALKKEQIENDLKKTSLTRQFDN